MNSHNVQTNSPNLYHEKYMNIVKENKHIDNGALKVITPYLYVTMFNSLYGMPVQRTL